MPEHLDAANSRRSQVRKDQVTRLASHFRFCDSLQCVRTISGQRRKVAAHPESAGEMAPERLRIVHDQNSEWPRRWGACPNRTS